MKERTLPEAVGDILTDAPAGDQWELTSLGRWQREIRVRHVRTNTLLYADASAWRVWQMRDTLAQMIQEAGGIVTKDTMQIGASRHLLRALQAVLVIAFAALLAWSYSDHIVTRGLAFEIGGGVALILAMHNVARTVSLRRLGFQTRLPGVFSGIRLRDARTAGWIDVRGIAASVAMSYLAIGLYALTEHAPFVIIAVFSLGLNAFLALPIPPLPGGRAVAVITPWLWLPGLLVVGGVAWWFSTRPFADGNAPLLLIGALAVGVVATIHGLWKMKRDSSYYRVSPRPHLRVLVPYLGVWAAIVVGLVLCDPIGGPAFDLIH